MSLLYLLYGTYAFRGAYFRRNKSVTEMIKHNDDYMEEMIRDVTYID